MNYKIATIEDDLLIAEDIRSKLEGLGHVVLGNARNYDEGISLAETTRPELIIADILLEGSKDGIETIAKIYEFHKCPVIYLSANSESTMVKRAMQTHPAAFLIKPFKLSEFAINIDLAIQNFTREVDFDQANPRITDSVFLPDQNTFVRVKKKDILYVKADGSYVEVVTEKKSYHLASNLKNFHRQFQEPNFIRVSRTYLINSDYVSRINGNMIYLEIAGKEIPLIFSKDKRQEILDRFQVLKTK
ncbi:MAG: LytTR family transcriptional regulator DNA-binding domain-containing protein [Cyclobacteriaceae bacterium]